MGRVVVRDCRKITIRTQWSIRLDLYTLLCVCVCLMAVLYTYIYVVYKRIVQYRPRDSPINIPILCCFCTLTMLVLLLLAYSNTKRHTTKRLYENTACNDLISFLAEKLCLFLLLFFMLYRFYDIFGLQLSCCYESLIFWRRVRE